MSDQDEQRRDPSERDRARRQLADRIGAHTVRGRGRIVGEVERCKRLSLKARTPTAQNRTVMLCDSAPARAGKAAAQNGYCEAERHGRR
jgi:hypothetical protein